MFEPAFLCELQCESTTFGAGDFREQQCHYCRDSNPSPAPTWTHPSASAWTKQEQDSAYLAKGTRRVCQTGKEAQGTVVCLQFAHQLIGHCQGYCWKLSRNELQGLAVVAVSWPHSQPWSFTALQHKQQVCAPHRSFLRKSPDYSDNCKTLLKMRMCSGVSENNDSKTLPTLSVYRVIIITGMMSWWVAHIDSLPGYGSADLDTRIINLCTRLTGYALELCSRCCKCYLWKRGAMTDKNLLISMFEEHLISQEWKKPNKKLVANMENIQLKEFSPCTTISIFIEEQTDSLPCA